MAPPQRTAGRDKIPPQQCPDRAGFGVPYIRWLGIQFDRAGMN